MAEEITNIEQTAQQTTARTPRHHTNPNKERGKFFALRQILNLSFMIIAIVGVAVYFWNEVYGIIIVIIAMAFKMAESVLRFIK